VFTRIRTSLVGSPQPGWYLLNLRSLFIDCSYNPVVAGGQNHQSTSRILCDSFFPFLNPYADPPHMGCQHPGLGESDPPLRGTLPRGQALRRTLPSDRIAARSKAWKFGCLARSRCVVDTRDSANQILLYAPEDGNVDRPPQREGTLG
jgi:hypothetical protein